MRTPNPPKQEASLLSTFDRSDPFQLILSGLLTLSPDAILTTDTDGVIRGSNPQATDLFGYAPAELIGMTIEKLMPERFRGSHPSHRENYNAHPRARQMGSAADVFCLRKDGAETPVDIMLKPLQTDTGPMVLCFIRDATERRAAQEVVRHQDRQISSMIESVLDYALFLLDRDGYVVTWHKGAECIKGYKPEEIIGKHFSRFFPQEDIERGHPAELMRLAGMRGRVEDEGWRVRNDGSRFWASSVLSAVRDSTGMVTGYTEVSRDSSDYKRAADAVMLHLSSVLLANMDVRKLLGAISESIREVIPHQVATLALYDTSLALLSVEFLELEEGKVQRGDVRLPVVGSAAGEAFSSREPVILERMEDSRFLPESHRHLTSLGMRSGCWVPLIFAGKAIGALAVASRHEGAFNVRDAKILTQVANQVGIAVNNAIDFRQNSDLSDRKSSEEQYLEDEVNIRGRFEDIVGESYQLRHVLNNIEIVAPTDATVLIEGETGTGKELLARAIHRLSPRHDRPFIKLNCAAIPAGLLESELFGHEKGAFTGAIMRKLGRLELAQGGTLFLDEVGELPLELQPKLLRALQEREIERLGGTRPIKVNVRLIAATNRNLGKMVAEGQFRADLFYRLKVFPVCAPPLRDRVSDIPLLTRHFVAIHSRRMAKNITTIPEATMEALMRWKWPGNIRELENFLERAVILTRGSVLYAPLAELEAEEEKPETIAEDSNLAGHERDLIIRAMRDAKGHISGEKGAAARLGLKRTTLNSKLKKLAIERRDYM